MSKIIGSDLIYVFGSNLAGLHNTTDAVQALYHHGAKMYSGEGREGNSYAIPYRGTDLQLLHKWDFKRALGAFCQYAREHSNLLFALTPVGVGRDDFASKDVIKWIKLGGLPSNVLLTAQWITKL